MRAASNTQLWPHFAKQANCHVLFHHAKRECATPIVDVLLQLCFDSAPILLYSVVVLECACYVEDSAGIIRICLAESNC